MPAAGTQLDLERALSLTASTEATLPSLQAAIDLGIYRLATLTAQPPAGLRARLTTPAPLPGLPVTDLAALPVGTPQQWMARRPRCRPQPSANSPRPLRRSA